MPYHQPPPPLLKLLSLPELSSEVLQYLWPSQILTLRLVSKTLEILCAPLVKIHVLPGYFNHSSDVLHSLVSKTQQHPSTRPSLPLLHYTTGLLTATQQVDDLVMASHNLHTLSLRPRSGNDAMAQLFDWFETHKDTTYPHIRALRLSFDFDTPYPQLSPKKILDRIINPTVQNFPNLESLYIRDNDANHTNIDFGILSEALTTLWTQLTTLSLVTRTPLKIPTMFLSRDTDSIVHLEGLVFPKVEVLEVMITEWSTVDVNGGWTFLDMFPNLKRLSIDIFSTPPNLDEDADDEAQQRRLRRLEQRLEQRGVLFPYLTNLEISISSKRALSRFPTLMGLSPSFTIPTRTVTLSSTTPIAITQYPCSHPPPPPLRSLAIDPESQDHSDAVSDILNHVGVSLQELRGTPRWAFSSDVGHFFSLLKSDCCSDLKVLALSEASFWDLGYLKLLSLLMAPVPVLPPVTVPAPGAMVPSSSPISNPNPNPNLNNTTSNNITTSNIAPLISTLGWTKALTELRLGSFVDDDNGQYADLDVISQLNRMLRLLKNLVVFELMHDLEDLELFNGMGRIPVHRIKYECERETEYKEKEEEETEKEGEYVWRRPLLESVYIRIREEHHSTKAACSFAVDDHAKRPVIPKLNTLLRLFAESDLNVFKGMSRIPVSRLKAEPEFFQLERGGIEKEKEKEKEKGGDGVGALLDAPNTVKFGVDGERYVLRHPLFENVEVLFGQGISFVDTQASFHERFPHLVKL
ncbi:hypothetical protein EC957_008647 [Mortierella hygrophila]|uniref:F-box domain-containing protein n=1 Tax=Mortierella hygrophila TaxID=979708 RepID=A0A9P6FCY1_9FUNG|nr:hypothetical protein EC957_008647 [Mortierella hygrophila]